jgi:hypothetical protein
MKIQRYQFKDGARIRGVKPDVAAAALRAISKEHGGLSAPTVVEAARPKSHPLHPAFEWDDGAAAEAYRCEQARLLMRSIRVVYMNDGKEEVRRGIIAVRTSVTDESAEDGEESLAHVYYFRDQVLKTPSLHEAAIMDARRMLLSAKERLSDITSAAPAERHIDRAVKVLDKVGPQPAA